MEVTPHMHVEKELHNLEAVSERALGPVVVEPVGQILLKLTIVRVCPVGLWEFCDK